MAYLTLTIFKILKNHDCPLKKRVLCRVPDIVIQKLKMNFGSSAPEQSITLIISCIAITTGSGHRLQVLAVFGKFIKFFDQNQRIEGFNLIIPRTRSPTWKFANSSTTGYCLLSNTLLDSSRQGLPGYI
jgi:hypothetical protein